MCMLFLLFIFCACMHKHQVPTNRITLKITNFPVQIQTNISNRNIYTKDAERTRGKQPHREEKWIAKTTNKLFLQMLAKSFASSFCSFAAYILFLSIKVVLFAPLIWSCVAWTVGRFSFEMKWLLSMCRVLWNFWHLVVTELKFCGFVSEFLYGLKTTKRMASCTQYQNILARNDIDIVCFGKTLMKYMQHTRALFKSQAIGLIWPNHIM